MRKDPMLVIQTLLQERYADAKAVFFAGSVAKNKGTDASDLDLVIVYDTLPNAYREAFMVDEWPIDAFVFDRKQLRFFLEESRDGSGISGLISMILEGVEIFPATDFSQEIKKMAEDFFKKGPAKWDKKKIDKERFLITDVLEDILSPVSRSEQIASAAWLYEALAQFYFRSKNIWCASGKSILRYLQKDDPELAFDFSQSFEKFFQTGKVGDVEVLVEKILEPFGGKLWDGFRSEAVEVKNSGEEKI